jgi:hypothetical protein
MNWMSGVAAIMVAVAVVLRLLWWARSNRLATQRQSLTENPTELCKTEHATEVNDKAPGVSRRKAKRCSREHAF